MKDLTILVIGWVTAGALAAILFLMSSGLEFPKVMNVLVQVMHFGFVVSSLFFMIKSIEQKRPVRFILTVLPILAFSLSLALLFLGHRLSKPFLAGFDLYVLVVWTFLLTRSVPKA